MDEALRLAELAPRIMDAFHDLVKQHPEDEKLSMRQYQALIIIHANTSLTLSQLCEKLGLAASTGTELANRMITLGYLQKGQEDKDHRQVALLVTSKGAEVLQKRQQILTAMFSDFLAPFQPNDRQRFVECFEMIWNLMSKYRS
jgi:MarR family transcriptional regulator, organic hydroperoxide resistance regulator